MNREGHRATLVASQPGNTNAVKHGVYSARLLSRRAAEFEAELLEGATFTVAQRVAVREVASLLALIEAMDADLAERGFVDRAGRDRRMAADRIRASRRLDSWLEQLRPALATAGPEELSLDEQRRITAEIARGQAADGRAADRLRAITVARSLPSPAQQRLTEAHEKLFGDLGS